MRTNGCMQIKCNAFKPLSLIDRCSSLKSASISVCSWGLISKSRLIHIHPSHLLQQHTQGRALE